MSAPFMNGGAPEQEIEAPPNPMEPANLEELIDALGRAAQQCAEKGASQQDGGQAKDYAAAASSYVTALMAIIAPKVEGRPEPSSDNGTTD